MRAGLPGSRNLTSPPPGYSPERSGIVAEALDMAGNFVFRKPKATVQRDRGVFIDPGVIGSLR